MTRRRDEDADAFEIGGQIGEGAFGRVMHARARSGASDARRGREISARGRGAERCAIGARSAVLGARSTRARD